MRVEVDGAGIEVEVTGEGQPVVLLHGFPDSGRLWHKQVPALAGARFQLIVPDLRGFGASDQPEGIEQYAIPALVGDVLGVMTIWMSSVRTSWDTIGKQRWHGRLGR